MTNIAATEAKHSRHIGLIAGACLIAAIVVIAVIAAKPNPGSEAPPDTATLAAPATPTTTPAATRSAEGLTAREAYFDFGTVSMAAGNVSHRYWFRNDSGAPVLVKRIYTSCMCTTATLVKAMHVIGTYGMAGHGPLPDVDQSFAAGEAAYVDVVFDPAAHGPAGLGHTERVVAIETDAGQRLQVGFVAEVRP
jgi:Protein of unknown function (DUF1573)